MRKAALIVFLSLLLLLTGCETGGKCAAHPDRVCPFPPPAQVK
jgi:hypothetical protein